MAKKPADTEPTTPPKPAVQETHKDGGRMQPDTDSLLASFREQGDRIRQIADTEFPAGSRVQPKGVTTGNWAGTVVALNKYDRMSTPSDMVFVEWDNGNRYPIRIDEIERRERSK